MLKDLSEFVHVPDQLKTKIFMKLFNVAEVAKFNEEEQRQYRESLKVYRDLKNSLDTAREEGREEGRETERLAQEAQRIQEQKQTVKALAKNGVAIETIIQVIGFSRYEIEEILSNEE